MKWDETTSQFKPLTMTWVETGVYPHIQWFIITWQWQLFYPVYPTSGFPLSICGWHRSFLKHRFSGNTLWETLTYIAIKNGPVETVSFFHEKCIAIFQFAMWQLPLGISTFTMIPPIHIHIQHAEQMVRSVTEQMASTSWTWSPKRPSGPRSHPWATWADWWCFEGKHYRFGSMYGLFMKDLWYINA